MDKQNSERRRQKQRHTSHKFSSGFFKDRGFFLRFLGEGRGQIPRKCNGKHEKEARESKEKRNDFPQVFTTEFFPEVFDRKVKSRTPESTRRHRTKQKRAGECPRDTTRPQKAKPEVERKENPQRTRKCPRATSSHPEKPEGGKTRRGGNNSITSNGILSWPRGQQTP